MGKMTIRDANVRSKRVLVRVDFNVPLGGNRVADATRIYAVLPTIQYLVENNARVILVSHLGRPKGKPDPQLKMDPVAKKLGEILNKEVKKIDYCIGAEAETAVHQLSPGEILLLENVRFYPGETENDPEFAKKLADLADIYVNDAFGTAHRAHASTVGVANYLPAVAGLLLEKEISVMGKILSNPERPLAAVVGGAKIADKLDVLKNFIGIVDSLAVGGGIANTFLLSRGLELGKSLVERDKMEIAGEILKEAREKEIAFYLPEDVVMAKEISPGAEGKVVSVDMVPSDMMALDIGPKTGQQYAEMIKKAKSVIWVGPMGVFEKDAFAEGTRKIAEAAAGVRTSIVGGGDTVAAAEKMGVSHRITHISTGGSASLKFLGGQKLPGIEILKDK
jgi:phosphoglycerate kinase